MSIGISQDIGINLSRASITTREYHREIVQPDFVMMNLVRVVEQMKMTSPFLKKG